MKLKLLIALLFITGIAQAQTRQTGGIGFTPQWNFKISGSDTTWQFGNTLMSPNQFPYFLTKWQSDQRYAPIAGGFVPTSRLISTGIGLLGGGNLGSNLTLTVDTANITSKTFFNTRIGTATQNVIDIKTPYVTPEQYGAVGNGVADDATALQNAVNSGKMVLLSKKYHTATTIDLLDRTSIKGVSDSAQIYIDGNYPAFRINDKNDINISGFKIVGNGRGSATDYTTIRPLQNGIYMTGGRKIRIDDMKFYKLGGSSVKTEYTYYSFHEGNIYSNLSVDSSFVGLDLAERSEYNSVTNLQSTGNEYGVRINGGNSSLVGGNLSNNRTAIKLESGANGGHGVISGFTINHSTEYALWADSVVAGMNITGNMIYYGNMLIDGSTDIKLSENFLYSNTITITATSTNTAFTNNKYITSPPTFSDSGVGTVIYSDAQVVNTVGNQTIDGIKTHNDPIYAGGEGSVAVRALSMGASGGYYGIVGYNAEFTTTNNTYNYGNTDVSSIIEFDGGFKFRTAPSGTVGDPITYTDRFIISNTGTITTPGLDNYSTDLSSSYTSRSKVDKAYVDAAVSGVGTSGTYTPTITNGANVSANTPHITRYTRVGNIVTVSGIVDLTVTAPATYSAVNISLPIASNLGTGYDLSGVGNVLALSSGAITECTVVGNSTSDVGALTFTSGAGTNPSISFTFSYQVI